MPSLRLGDIAPDFEANTTNGPIKFHEWIGDSWAILFSHPADFSEAAKLEPEFKKRNVKLIGLSTDGLKDHATWVDDINEVNGVNLKYPIIADEDRRIATTYEMLDQESHDPTNVVNGIPFTVRTVFIIDPKKRIRLTQTYPANCGRNFDEILRVVDSLHLYDRHLVATPANWKAGDDVIVHPSISTEEAKERFPKVKVLKPYLRKAQLPPEDN
ncbi:Proteasome subunit alpha type-2 [Spiromyces aspiralis]|uniref:Proteasome subunit alpha type-2 n=1 Tax=Spiromyces aspiralis TaxID=68401 RepID=A0ACC1HV04_9FUNG|nr:Proteasome subunit alpha type-2 [Spiromyces aspiralis]